MARRSEGEEGSMETAVRVEHLVKHFKDIKAAEHAVDLFNFSQSSNELCSIYLMYFGICASSMFRTQKTRESKLS